jgi:RNA polymerase II C-terminal domain phosphatase-like 1/2
MPGGMELHLVAMNVVRKQQPYFWGFVITSGLYKTCLSMLNLRCLALVFDLDETLIVANTMRSYEDRIDALNSKIKVETELQKASGMTSELKRYTHDRAMLKQYIEEDRVWDNIGEKFVAAQMELVPSFIEGGPPLKRPVVRLPDRDMIFTRINPNVSKEKIHLLTSFNILPKYWQIISNH